MQQIGIRDLKTRLSEVLRDVAEQGHALEVTERGKPVARLVPGSSPTTKDEDLAESAYEPVDPVEGEVYVAEAQPHWDGAVRPRRERIGVRDLKGRTSEVIKEVSVNKRIYEITRQGKVIVRMTPAYKLLTPEEWIASAQELIDDIARNLPPDLVTDSVELVNEGRDRIMRLYEEGRARE